MLDNIMNKLKGWWHKMFDYNKVISDFGLDLQTSKEILDAIQNWTNIFNGKEPWINEKTTSLHVAKTICEKVAEATVVEYKSVCDEPYINPIYQKFLKNIQTNTEYMIGKSCIFFKPYFDGQKININVVQADKFIPVKFSDDGELLSCIILDQITEETTIYTRLEYCSLNDNVMTTKNIAYKGRKDGAVLESKIDLKSVDKWKDIEENSAIEGIDRLIGGFATTKLANTIDNSSPIGMPIYHNALDTLKEIDKQFSRTLWEYEGSELAIDVDETILEPNGKGGFKSPKGKDRLFRRLHFDEVKDKSYNVFSPEIRDTSMFNGLNELLQKAEVQCHLEHGILSKPQTVEKTATEMKIMKQSYYTTVKNIQTSMQQALDDLIYGIYVLCKLYGIPVRPNYVVEHDWDDSILVDKEQSRNQALIERNNQITSDVQYVMETRNMKEKEAIEFIKKQQEYRKLTQEETQEEEEPEE